MIARNARRCSEVMSSARTGRAMASTLSQTSNYVHSIVRHYSSVHRGDSAWRRDRHQFISKGATFPALKTGRGENIIRLMGKKRLGSSAD